LASASDVYASPFSFDPEATSESETESETLHGRPRQRLQMYGAQALSDSELIALLLRTGGGGADAAEVSRDLLKEFGGLLGLSRFATSDLSSVCGVGPAKLATIRACLEIARRIGGQRLPLRKSIRNPSEIYAHFYSRLRNHPQENFLVLLLDGRQRVLREVVVSEGTLTASLVHPREVFREAVRESAASLVLIHNHPSGDPSPSAEDREVTERLSRAGEIVGIRVLDHVVIAEHGYFSFRESGDLE
jgi:DNA repair protein RadC